MTETQAWMEVGDAGALLGLQPIEVLAWVHLYGLPTASGRVGSSAVPVLARKLGKADAGTEAALEVEDDPSADTVANSIHADTDSRRRFLRSLLYRMERRGYWAPTGTRLSSLRRGFADRESNWVRDAVEALHHAGWIDLPGTRKSKMDSYCGLNQDRRDEIVKFIRTGRSTSKEVASWVRS